MTGHAQYGWRAGAAKRGVRSQMSDDELPFRIAALALFIGVRFVRWHVRRVVAWRATWPAMRKNPLDTAVLLTLSVAWLAAIFLYVALPIAVAPFHVTLPAWLRWCAVPMAVASLGLLYWADRSLGNNLSVSLVIRDHHTLVSHGPYRRIRHPIYTAALTYAAALSTITANYVLAAMIFIPSAVLVAGGCPARSA